MLSTCSSRTCAGSKTTSASDLLGTRETAFVLLHTTPSANGQPLSPFSTKKNVFYNSQFRRSLKSSLESMSKSTHKQHSCSRYYVITVLAGILCAAFIVDFLFSGSSSAMSAVSSSSLRPSKFILIPVDRKVRIPKRRRFLPL